MMARGRLLVCAAGQAGADVVRTMVVSRAAKIESLGGANADGQAEEIAASGNDNDSMSALVVGTVAPGRVSVDRLRNRPVRDEARQGHVDLVHGVLGGVHLAREGSRLRTRGNDEAQGTRSREDTVDSKNQKKNGSFRSACKTASSECSKMRCSSSRCRRYRSRGNHQSVYAGETASGVFRETNRISLDGLLANAKAALHHGDPQRAEALLNQIPPLDLKSDDVVIVNKLRAAAERAAAKNR